MIPSEPEWCNHCDGWGFTGADIRNTCNYCLGSGEKSALTVLNTKTEQLADES